MASSPEAPIVLVHGILGFDRLGLPDSPISYFRGIPDALAAAGHSVPEPPALNPAGSVTERAADLKDYLLNHEDVRGRRVHLIAHSMGGLDSRYMISGLGMADRVLSLTTLCTPHHGTSIADLNLAVFGLGLDVLDETRLVDLRGFLDLTRRHSREFDEVRVPDAAGVRYFSVAGLYEPGLVSFDLLKLTHDFISANEGGNDGLVSVTSATFGTFLGTWPGDHFRLINWPTNILEPVDEFADDSVVENYLSLAERLFGEPT
jgi:triacylglycerol lipase